VKTLFQTAAMASPMVIADMTTWRDGVHVDLKSFNPAYYKSVLGGSLCAVKENLKTLAKSGLWLEVTTLVINGVNDSNSELEKIAMFIAQELGPHVPWHVSAFTPANYRLSHPPTSTSALLRAFDAGKAAGLHHVYFGNVPWINETRCPQCDTLLMQRHEYDILENNLKEGCCPSCKRTIEGVWS
jgi:pyruvate formate lyase activating enzyme